MATANSTSTPRSATTIDGACVHYGNTVALAPTTLTIRAGESVALVGANGSGKTTLLSILAGLVDPDDGTVERPGPVAMVTQHRDHHRWMPLSVDEVLRMGRYPRRGLLGRLGSDDRQAIDAAAELLEVTHLRRRPFGDLSGGQQQRVLVAQAIASQPDLLLLDEPITGLDLPSQLRILDVIEQFAADGGAVVFSTHHLSEARRADRVMLMAGCVLADGAPDDVLVPALLAEAFGGRMISDDGTSIVVDEHGHDHGDPHAPELVPHHGAHEHEHEHEHADD
ncbi:MAG: metal ABC transporter ATP-binding protein [Ilumatobacter sp.]|nr:metal ABC transporter ATP-binding protein [Ilumatobacter sp.]